MRTDASPERVRILATDVDGVLTDGRIYLASDGTEMKAFHVRDGAGIKYAQRAGLIVAFITGRSSPLVEHRAAELGVTDIFQGAIDKRIPFAELLAKHEIDPGEVCYIGDDLLDIPILSRVGFAVAVADARPEVIEVCHHVTDAAGGGGAMREVVEHLLKIQGQWADILARYQDRP
jgi:3-deoxy-D-manno-octulosonate 8-phosphate phosphatase (KDO 8-P phosphatase)